MGATTPDKGHASRRAEQAGRLGDLAKMALLVKL